MAIVWGVKDRLATTKLSFLFIRIGVKEFKNLASKQD